MDSLLAMLAQVRASFPVAAAANVFPASDVERVAIAEAVTSNPDYVAAISAELVKAGISAGIEVDMDYWYATVELVAADGKLKWWQLTPVAGEGDWPAGWYLLPELEPHTADAAGNRFEFETITLDPAASLNLPVAADPADVVTAVVVRART